MPETKNQALKIAAAVAVSFTTLVGIVIWLMVRGVITFQFGLLSMIGLFGLYFGFGVLIAVYRFTARLR